MQHLRMWRNGRRASLRSWCPRRGGSSPFIRTTMLILFCGSGSVVERYLAKVDVASSNLVFRSTKTQFDCVLYIDKLLTC